jgi:hypothetical protein
MGGQGFSGRLAVLRAEGRPGYDETRLPKKTKTDTGMENTSRLANKNSRTRDRQRNPLTAINRLVLRKIASYRLTKRSNRLSFGWFHTPLFG